MGINPVRARGSVRFSLGIYNTEPEVDYLLAQLPEIIERLRTISPLDSKHPGQNPAKGNPRLTSQPG